MDGESTLPPSSVRTARPSRSFQRDPAPPIPWTLSPGMSLAVAVWAGLLTGAIELATLVIRNQITGGVSLGFLQMNRHYHWMIPAADGLLFGAFGIAMSVGTWFRPRALTAALPRILVFLAAFSLLLLIPGMFIAANAAFAAGISAVANRRLRIDGRRFCGFVRWTLPPFLILPIGLAAWGFHDAALGAITSNGSSPVPPAAPNILLIVLDTVRAQSLSLYGHDRETTPNLALLAERGVRFDQARATAPWTLPSHASLFTGRWPHELRVGEERGLDGRFPTLAEFLRDRGYETAGFVANTYFCNSWYGLGRGFQTYQDMYEADLEVSLAETLRCSALGRRVIAAVGLSASLARPRKDAAQINQSFLEWLSGRERGRFFAFLNYFDAHTPYLLPDGEDWEIGQAPRPPEERELLRTWHERPRHAIKAEEIELARDAYESCIRYLDGQLGRLFDELRRRDLLRETLVVITSDHGEHLGEHGLQGHGKSLYSQELHVPLLVIPPGGLEAPVRVGTPVSLRDLPRTVAELVDSGAGPTFPGGSLARFWRQTEGSTTGLSPAFGEVSLRKVISRNPDRPPAWRGPMSSVLVDRHSLIRNADGREEMYLSDRDPGEVHDLSGETGVSEQFGDARATLDSVRPPASPED